MPEYILDGSRGEHFVKKEEDHCVPHKENLIERSPRSPLSRQSPTLSTMSPESDSLDLTIDGVVNPSIDELYNNVCEMQSSDQSPSRRSFLSYGEESRIDSELHYFAGGNYADVTIEKRNGDRKSSDVVRGTARKGPIRSKTTLNGRPPNAKQSVKGSKSLATATSMKVEKSPPLAGTKGQNGPDDSTRVGFLGPYLLKQARDVIASGGNVQKALELALRATKSFELSADRTKPDLDFVMCLHVVSALYCRLNRYSEAIPYLERSIDLPILDLGHNHALAKFAGCMQLGDTYAMLGQIENSIMFYTAGSEIQQQVLGANDPRFAETCRYLAEAHVQAIQFEEAEKLCLMALDIHRENSSSTSREEAADRRLLGLICDSKGDYEGALEHYVLASMSMAAEGEDADVAAIDCSIGDAYLSLARYDEAVKAYQKALNMFKSCKGENHPSVASVLVRLADLHNKIGKFSESKAFCDSALRIYSKPVVGSPCEEIASGLVDISGIFESMGETGKALELLEKAIKVYGNAPGQQSIIAGIEAQMGVLYYMVGNYSESYEALKIAVMKFRSTGEKKSALFGIALNQMGLACVHLFHINEAADLFEEARDILEAQCGPYHADTLGVYSNLAGTYDAMGRTGDAIEILEYIVEMREEKLGTANPDVEDEKRRLETLLKEAGMVRTRKSRSLETLLVKNSNGIIPYDENEVC